MIRRGPATTPAPPAEESVRLVRTLTVTVFLLWLGSTSIIPMLPVYIRHLGGTDALAGLVMASFFAAGVLTQYPMGKLADRVGCKPVLVAGIVVYAIACFGFLFPIAPAFAIVLRGMQGLGAGGAAVASLAMVSSAVAVERRGRAFASVISAEIAGMAVGPLIGAIVGYRFMWFMFLGSGIVALAAAVPALRIVEPKEGVAQRTARTDADGALTPLAKLHWTRPMIGALIAAAALGLGTGIYDICWTLLLLSRGATGWQIGISWTLFAIPFIIAARPSGWLADHMDRRYLVLGGLGLAALFCASYPFIHWIPALMVLGGIEAIGFAAAMPSLQSLLTQGSEPSEVGRIQGMFGTTQTALTAVSTAAAGAAFAVASWIPFVASAVLTAMALIATAIVWRPVAGHVHAKLTSLDVVADVTEGGVSAAPSPSTTSVAGPEGDLRPDASASQRVSASRPDDGVQEAVGVNVEVQ